MPALPHQPSAEYQVLFALLGLLFGSFLNVCISRLPAHRSIAFPGSHCPACGAPVRARDNIPVLSWLLLRARCRDCGARIAWRYPAVELATAGLFLLSIRSFGLTVDGFSAALLSFLLLGLLVMDVETFRLPDSFTLPGLALGLVHAAVVAGPPLVHRLSDAGGALIAAAVAFLLLLTIRTVYWLVRRREGLGFGDVKLLAMIAAWLGLVPTVLALLLAVLAAAMAGIAVILAASRGDGKQDWRTARLPLGAFFSAAALVVLFTGNSLLNWYMGQFR